MHLDWFARNTKQVEVSEGSQPSVSTRSNARDDDDDAATREPRSFRFLGRAAESGERRWESRPSCSRRRGGEMG